jgi:hypothetical protein
VNVIVTRDDFPFHRAAGLVARSRWRRRGALFQQLIRALTNSKVTAYSDLLDGLVAV